MFTVEPFSGLCNTLKTFITFSSVGKTNIKCRTEWESKYVCQPKDFGSILDQRHICKTDAEYGIQVTGWRFLILETEDEQMNLKNELPGESSVFGDIKFSSKTIDNFYDRFLISDKVFNRIMTSIDTICWKPEILSEVEQFEKEIVHPALTINIRTWKNKYDTLAPLPRPYDFETYKNAIQMVLPNCKTIVLSTDNDDVLPQYLDLLKSHNVIVYKQKEGMNDLQCAAINMLLSSKCDYMICSRLSTYAECIWWFSRCKQKVIPLF
jgi:hypothetical protein